MQQHTTVLRDEAVEALGIVEGNTIVDATYGSGGHSQIIHSRIGENGTLVALDADESALEESPLKDKNNVLHINANYRDVDAVLRERGIEYVDGILADLGWRIEEFFESGKGFSFQKDEPLIMTYGDPKAYPFTAHDIVNEWSEESLGNVLKGYGEERFARRIAGAIVAERGKGEIESTKELVDVILKAIPKRFQRGKIHPATKTFQGLRIAVNDELGALEEFVGKAAELLTGKGRLVIITFHSTEDRIVKHSFRALQKEGVGTVVTKKPIRPTREEVVGNPRSRSAKMRIFEKNE